MLDMKPMLVAGVLAVSVSFGAACSDEPSAVAIGDTELLSVLPAGGSTDVDPAASVVVEFTHAMMAGMDQYMTLHEGSIAGPLVEGTWSWNAERTRATFTQSAPLGSATTYVIHVGGGVRDAGGSMIGFEGHAPHHGGRTATSGMMNDAMAGRGMMMEDHGDMMGEGWARPDGTWGMVFTFTTR